MNLFESKCECLVNADLHKNKASDIWIKNAKRIEIIEEIGYDILVVWERDYRQSPNDGIEQCKAYLYG